MTLQKVRRTAQYLGLARDAYQLRHARTDKVRRLAQRHLVERMGRLRGLPQKLGQMISFSHAEEQSDSEAVGGFAALQDSAEPLPLDDVLPVIEAAWKVPAFDILATIQPDAHAASLGQVHHAVTHDGRQLAVKIQYPGIRDAVDADLKMLGWLSVPVGNLRRGFDMSGYKRVILEDLDRELDYLEEADNQRSFERWADTTPDLAVPRVVDELSTAEVLVSSWEDGDDWTTVCAMWPEADRRRLANILLRFFLEGLFGQRMLHADWHPGNMRFRRGSEGVQLLLYDFGCVYYPSDDVSLALLRLIRATMARDESPFGLFLKLGFSPEFLDPLASKLPALCRVLFEPFCAEYPYEMEDWNLSERVADVLGDDRWNFRIAGPPELIFLMRAFQGLKFYLEGLGTPIFWGRALTPYFDRFGSEMDRLSLPSHDAGQSDFSTLARHLKICVMENGCKKVELTAYASGIENLDTLVDDNVKERIRERGIVLSDVIRDVRRRGYAPGPVFELEEGAKRISVWLE